MASPTVFGALIPCQQPTYDPFHLLTVSLFEDQSRPGAFTKHLRTPHLRTSTHHFPMAHDRLAEWNRPCGPLTSLELISLKLGVPRTFSPLQ